MEKVCGKPGPCLTVVQRDALLGWMSAGILDYTAIKQKLITHGFPLIKRQAIDHYRQKLRRGMKVDRRCFACGQSLPAKHEELPQGGNSEESQ